MEGMINLLRTFTDPIIGSPPKNLKEDIIISRMIQTKRAGADGKIDMATDTEALAYVMTASLEAPLDSEWTSIYMHLAYRYLEWKNKDIPDFLKNYKEIDDYHLNQLNDLKRWIKRRQIQHNKIDKREFKQKFRMQTTTPRIKDKQDQGKVQSVLTNFY